MKEAMLIPKKKYENNNKANKTEQAQWYGLKGQYQLV